MPRIFISYRRAASAGQAGRLYDRLSKAFGDENVFMDIDKIPAGETFESYILREIERCDVFLAMLSEGTLGAGERRRIFESNDWVRREIVYALSLPHVRVIPVLIDGFKMPKSEDLPDDLHQLRGLNSEFLRHELFEETSSKIIRRIKQLSRRRLPRWGIIGLALLLCSTLIGVSLNFESLVTRFSALQASPIITLQPSQTTTFTPEITIAPTIEMTHAAETQQQTSEATLAPTLLSLTIDVERSGDTIALCVNQHADLSALQVDLGNNERYILATEFAASGDTQANGCWCLQQNNPRFPAPNVCSTDNTSVVNRVGDWRNADVTVTFGGDSQVCPAQPDNLETYSCTLSMDGR